MICEITTKSAKSPLLGHCLLILAAGLFVAGSPEASAAVRTDTVTYQDGDAVLEGYLAYDDASPNPRPGVLVVHEWKGLNEYAKRRRGEAGDAGRRFFSRGRGRQGE